MNNYLGDISARDAATAANVAAGVTATAAQVGLLTTLGVSAQVVPVVGQIAGGILLITGYIIAAQAKAKSVKNNIASVETAQQEYRQQMVELDQMVAIADQRKATILTDLNKLGVSVNGLGSIDGFSDWLQKTFTPGKYYGNILTDANTELARLEAEVRARIGYLERTKTELETLYDKLTNAKLKRGLLWGGGIAATLIGLYFLNKEFKWIKL